MLGQKDCIPQRGRRHRGGAASTKEREGSGGELQGGKGSHNKALGLISFHDLHSPPYQQHRGTVLSGYPFVTSEIIELDYRSVATIANN